MPRALLVHGLQSSAAGWWQVEAWLRDAGWEVTTRNLLGHGGRGPASDYSFASYADDLDEDHQDWDLVVAHSLGAAVAVTIATRRPAFADRLIMIDPAIVIPDDVRATVTAELLNDLLATRETLIASEPDWVENDIRAKLFSLDGLGTETTEKTVEHNQPWNVRPLVAQLAMPTLLLTGDPAVSTTIPPELAAELAANRVIDYRVVPGGNHSPHRNRAEATRTAIIGWLASTDSTVE